MMSTSTMTRVFELISRMREQYGEPRDLFAPMETELPIARGYGLPETTETDVSFFKVLVKKIDIPEMVIACIKLEKIDNQRISYAYCVSENYGTFEVASLDHPNVKIIDKGIELTYQSDIEELIKRQLPSITTTGFSGKAAGQGVES